jgi:hypothetical protein
MQGSVVSCNCIPVLFRGCSWKKMQMVLEAEARSRVAVKELLKRLFAVSQEISGTCFTH